MSAFEGKLFLKLVCHWQMKLLLLKSNSQYLFSNVKAVSAVIFASIGSIKHACTSQSNFSPKSTFLPQGHSDLPGFLSNTAV
jgi:hypothetical protein